MSLAMLLPPLREFEISIIVRFLLATIKLTAFSLPPRAHLFSFLNFLDSFTHLGGIEVPEPPADLLTPQRAEVLKTAKSLSLSA